MDPNVRKEVLRLIPYGVYAVTCRAGHESGAFCASWLTQCSFEPPQVALGVRPDSHCHRLISASGAFAVHWVHHHQAGFLKLLFSPTSRIGDKLRDCHLEDGVTGAPIITDAVAYCECKVVEAVTAGDHTLFVADVVACGRLDDDRPLLLADTPWHYGG